MRHIKTSIIETIDLNEKPFCSVKWKQKKNIFGKVVKEGYYDKRMKWISKLPEDYTDNDGVITAKPIIELSGGEGFYCSRRFDTIEEAEKYYVWLISNISKLDFIEF